MAVGSRFGYLCAMSYLDFKLLPRMPPCGCSYLIATYANITYVSAASPTNAMLCAVPSYS
jgi:hypothetical protein